MIEIPELGDDFHRMWEELFDLAGELQVPWTLIGAHMVALHGWGRARDQIRPSRDADILVNVRAMTDGTEQLSEVLIQRHFTFDGISPEGIGHRFIKDGVSIDVLGPEGLGERASLRTVAGARTVRVPGGTQALRRSEPIDVKSRSSQARIPLPSLLGALLIKVRAIGVDDEPQAQRQDSAFLLSLVDDPDGIGAELSSAERGWLRRHPYLGDPTSDCYRDIPNAEDAAIVYRRLSKN